MNQTARTTNPYKKSEKVSPFSNKHNLSQNQEYQKEGYSRIETATSPRSEVAKFSVALSKKEMMIEKSKCESSFNRFVESKIRFENEILPKRSRGQFNPHVNPKKPETFKPSVRVFSPPSSLTGPEHVIKRVRSPPNHDQQKRNPIIEGDIPRAKSPKPKFEYSKETLLLNEKKHLGAAYRVDSPTKKDTFAYKMRHKTNIDWTAKPEPLASPKAHKKANPSNQFGKDMKSILQYEFHTPRASFADIRASLNTSPKTELKNLRLKTLC